MDFRQAVIGALDHILDTNVIQIAIAKALEKTIENVVKNELESYSDFGKRLQAAVKQSLALHGSIDVPSYNDAILKIVSAQLEAKTHAVIQQQVAANLKELLEPAPAAITLTALCESYIEFLKKHRDAGCVCHGEQIATMGIRPSDYDFRYVFFDDEPKKPPQQCDVELGIAGDGRIFSLRFRDRDVEKQLFAGPFYGFQRRVFQMKAAQTRIVIDCDPADLDVNYGTFTD